MEETDFCGIGVDAAVPDDGEAGERFGGQDELGAAVGVLAIGADEGGDGGVEVLVLGGEADGGAEFEAEAFSLALGYGDERVLIAGGGLGGVPPGAFDDGGSGWRARRSR